MFPAPVNSPGSDRAVNGYETSNKLSSYAVVPSFAPPGSTPAGHRFAGGVYSARASGALIQTGKPMVLRLSYDPAALAGADPRTLAIVAWVADPINPHWERLGGQLFADQGYVSVATKSFTTYALMATTTWRDSFEDFELGGLDQARTSNITLDLLGENLALALQDTPGQGAAVSLPITLTTVISGWGTLIFTGTAPAPHHPGGRSSVTCSTLVLTSPLSNDWLATRIQPRHRGTISVVKRPSSGQWSLCMCRIFLVEHMHSAG